MPSVHTPPTREDIARAEAKAGAASGGGQGKAFVRGGELGATLAFLLLWGYLSWSVYIQRQKFLMLRELDLSQETVQDIQNSAASTSDLKAILLLCILAYFAFKAWNKFRQPHWNKHTKEKWLGFACAFGFVALPFVLIWIT